MIKYSQAFSLLLFIYGGVLTFHWWDPLMRSVVNVRGLLGTCWKASICSIGLAIPCTKKLAGSWLSFPYVAPISADNLPDLSNSVVALWWIYSGKPYLITDYDMMSICFSNGCYISEQVFLIYLCFYFVVCVDICFMFCLRICKKILFY